MSSELSGIERLELMMSKFALSALKDMGIATVETSEGKNDVVVTYRAEESILRSKKAQLSTIFEAMLRKASDALKDKLGERACFSDLSTMIDKNGMMVTFVYYIGCPLLEEEVNLTYEDHCP